MGQFFNLVDVEVLIDPFVKQIERLEVLGGPQVFCAPLDRLAIFIHVERLLPQRLLRAEVAFLYEILENLGLEVSWGPLRVHDGGCDGRCRAREGWPNKGHVNLADMRTSPHVGALSGRQHTEL